jgi:DNA ligase (NAD+)
MTPTQIEEAISKLKFANERYRQGSPIMPDDEYDALKELVSRFAPDDEFITEIEPEPEDTFGGRRVVHEERMLSMLKVYTRKKLEAFFNQVNKAAEECGVEQPLLYSIQPKLDGIAGNLSKSKVLATRGKDGTEGEDVSVALERGLVLEGDCEYGCGELVVDRKYFVDNLAYDEELNPDGFKSPRSFMAGLLSSDELKPLHVEATEAGMARMVFYSSLPSVLKTSDEILDGLDALQELRLKCAYDTDGVVISADDPRIRDHMGATNRHHRHQVAFKQKGETADTTINSIVYQTGRTGHVTPVAHFDPVLLPGALVSKATVHNIRFMCENKLGVGARVTIIRSGEVIPKIDKVLIEAKEINPPTSCPSCGSDIIEDGAFMTCISASCPSQVSSRLFHFFHTINIAKGFGVVAVKKLVEAGFDTVPKVFNMGFEDIKKAGFGDGQADNLISEITLLKRTPVAPWLFLGALGIHHLGRGSAITLLSNFGTVDKVRSVSADEIESITGFGDKTAPYIHAALARRSEEIDLILAHVNLKEATDNTGPLSGMILVFTGTMSSPRAQMEDTARKFGAQVGTTVTRKTTALVTGSDVGEAKTAKATKLGVAIWSEDDFSNRISV